MKNKIIKIGTKNNPATEKDIKQARLIVTDKSPVGISQMKVKLYKNPEKTGWMGWIEIIGTDLALGFIRKNGQIEWN